MRGFRDRSQKESDGTLLEERSGGTRNTAGKVGKQCAQREKPTRDSQMRQRKRPAGRKTPRVLKSLQAGEKGAASVSFNSIQDGVNGESVAARQSSSDTKIMRSNRRDIHFQSKQAGGALDSRARDAARIGVQTRRVSERAESLRETRDTSHEERERRGERERRLVSCFF